MEGLKGEHVCERVVLVDDDALYVAALEALLARTGRFQVVGRARNGREALDVVAALLPDLVVMDIDMPIMDGVEATRQLRQVNPFLVVIIVSGERDERVGAAQLAGASGFVPKVRAPIELVPAIDAVCGNAGALASRVA